MKKVFSIIIIFFLILNIALFAMGLISTLLFWIIIGLGLLSSLLINKLKD